MPKLTIEAQVDEGLIHVTHVKVDEEPIKCIQSLKLELNDKELELEAVFPDTDEGWAYAEYLHAVPFCTSVIAGKK